MEPTFLIPEQTVEKNGASEPIALGDSAGKMLLLTLGILDVVEQESLDVAVYGSADGQEWEKTPLRVFPQKFYRGSSSLLCDLSSRPEIKFLRGEWKVHRWGVGYKTPRFRFYLFTEEFQEPAAQQQKSA